MKRRGPRGIVTRYDPTPPATKIGKVRTEAHSGRRLDARHSGYRGGV